MSLLAIALGRAAAPGSAMDLPNQAGSLLPALGVASFLIVLALAATRRTRIVAAAGLLVACVALWVSLTMVFATPWPAPRPGERAIRVVAFNAWLNNRSPAVAARWIAAQQPDVVVLLESAGRSAGIAQSLAAALPYRTTCRLERRCSTVILSRVPPVERRGLARGDADNREALSAAYMRFGPAQGGFAVLAVHLSHGAPFGLQRRDVAQLVADMRGTANRRLIVAGDFNATPQSATVRTIETALGVRLTGVTASWPARSAGWPVPALFAIDHALLGSGWRAARSVRGLDLGSDHYPFVITATPDTDAR